MRMDAANAYEAAQRRRWMRPDADRWLRPDAARFLKPGRIASKAFFGAERKYNPNQPRVPAGNPDGGQWTGLFGKQNILGYL